MGSNEWVRAEEKSSNDRERNNEFEPLLTLPEAAEILRLHSDTVKRMAQQGVLPAIKVGKYWRFRASCLDEWIRIKLRSASTQATPR